MGYDLLNDAIVEASLAGRPRMVTLPGLFAAWGQGEDLILSGIRQHQRPPIHMLLVQAAVTGTLRADSGQAIDADEETWRDRLLALAPAESWRLVAEPSDAPAFLQPPVAADDLKRFKETAHADDLTVLVAAKNHAVKQSVMGDASPWQWCASLIELQTSVGFSGRGNFGIIRMNGGFGSRPLVAAYPDMREGARWAHDTSALIARIDDVHADAIGFADQGEGLVATWLSPWDGKSQLVIGDLDPLCIEVARRVRLVMRDGRITALVGTSDCMRIGGTKDLSGRVGDPWCPVSVVKAKSLTVGAEGWTLHTLCNLILSSGDLRQSLLQHSATDGVLHFHAAVMTGGQGGTDGYHEVTIPIPAETSMLMSLDTKFRDRLARMARTMIQEADKVSWILRKAVLSFAQGGVPLGDVNSTKEADTTLAAFKRDIEAEFFPQLWQVSAEAGDANLAWRRWLQRHARDAYEDATRTVAVRTDLFWKAETIGRGILLGLLSHTFPSNQTKDGTVAEGAGK
jgi:CRISPR system Cascade subunit CasA